MNGDKKIQDCNETSSGIAWEFWFPMPEKKKYELKQAEKRITQLFIFLEETKRS